jgi:hypothetical protein
MEGGVAATNFMAQSLGGGVKGLGDLVTGGAIAASNPLAPIKGLLDMAEHTPGPAGTALKGAHGLYDIATGNEKGEYGKNTGELWNNLTDFEKQGKQDQSFWAQLGGGEKAWKDKPVEAFSRTLTNLLPMILGEVIEGPMTGPKVIEPGPYGPRGPARGPARGPVVPSGPEVPPPSKGPPSTRPYGPEFFDRPPQTRPYGPEFFDRPPPTRPYGPEFFDLPPETIRTGPPSDMPPPPSSGRPVPSSFPEVPSFPSSDFPRNTRPYPLPEYPGGGSPQRMPRLGPGIEEPIAPPEDSRVPSNRGDGPATRPAPRAMKDMAERVWRESQPQTERGLGPPWIPPAPDIPWWVRR